MGKFYEGVYEELSLYVRQCAWLHAVPEQKSAAIGSRTEPVSRLQGFHKEGKEVPVPEVELGYLVAYLWEVGPTMQGSMGDSPLTHGEIESWTRLIGLELHPWEVRILKRLSFDYMAQEQRSKKEDCPAPYGFKDRAWVAKKVDEIFG